MNIDRKDIENDPLLLDKVYSEWLILRGAVTESPVPFCVYDGDDRLVAWNRSYESIHQRAFDACRADVEAGTLNYRDLLRYQLDAKLSDPEIQKELDRRVTERRESDGAPVFQEYEELGHYKIYRYSLQHGAIAGFAMDVNDLIDYQAQIISARKEAEEFARELELAKSEIEKIAYLDELTGIPNRRQFRERFKALRGDDSVRDKTCYLLHIDLDKFKQINDFLGHGAGDHVLYEFSQLISGLCQDKDFAVRLGGDEFALVMVDNDDAASAERVARHIIAELSQPILYEGTPCQIGASIGVSKFVPADAKLDEILSESDLAMYRAKESGRNTVVHFETALRSDYQSRSLRYDELRVAIADDQFLPHYQPQFRCSDRTLWGVEAFCRWQHPEHDLLSASEFLETANALSLAGDIDRCVFERVAEDLDWFESAGMVLPKISLNVGYERLLDSGLVNEFAALKRPGLVVAAELVGAHYLDSSSGEIPASIHVLEQGGISIEMDDFGNQAISPRTMVSLSPTALKIDREIVRVSPKSPPMQSLIKTIVEIGRSMGIPVVAKGVETAAHIDLVCELGCDFMQGYALAKPMSRDSLLDAYGPGTSQSVPRVA